MISTGVMSCRQTVASIMPHFNFFFVVVSGDILVVVFRPFGCYVARFSWLALQSTLNSPKRPQDQRTHTGTHIRFVCKANGTSMATAAIIRTPKCLLHLSGWLWSRIGWRANFCPFAYSIAFYWLVVCQTWWSLYISFFSHTHTHTWRRFQLSADWTIIAVSPFFPLPPHQ